MLHVAITALLQLSEVPRANIGLLAMGLQHSVDVYFSSQSFRNEFSRSRVPVA